MVENKITLPISVVGLSGSLRQNSFTHKAVKIALIGAEKAGADTRLIHLGDYELPFCSGNSRERNYPQDVYRLRADVSKAHGVILGSPEYHGGMSGVLKNALDLMGFEEFEGKLIGLVGVAGGQLGATNALTSLRNVGRALHAWVIPDQVSIPQAWRQFNPDGTIKDDRINERLQRIGDQVVHYAYLHTLSKENQFISELQAAPENPGGFRNGAAI